MLGCIILEFYVTFPIEKQFIQSLFQRYASPTFDQLDVTAFTELMHELLSASSNFEMEQLFRYY